MMLVTLEAHDYRDLPIFWYVLYFMRKFLSSNVLFKLIYCELYFYEICHNM